MSNLGRLAWLLLLEYIMRVINFENCRRCVPTWRVDLNAQTIHIRRTCRISSQSSCLHNQPSRASELQEDWMKIIGQGQNNCCSLVALWLSNMTVYLRDGSAWTNLTAATMRQNLQIKLAISPNYSILTLGQPVVALTLQCQASCRAATRELILSQRRDRVWRKPQGESDTRSRDVLPQGHQCSWQNRRHNSATGHGKLHHLWNRAHNTARRPMSRLTRGTDSTKVKGGLGLHLT